MTDALTITDEASAAVATAPRVSKLDIEAKIARVSYINPARATAQLVSATDGLKSLTICVIEMQNGFTVLGESAPASPENFDEQLGQQFAYENAFRKLWPLEGYLLRERLHLGEIAAIAPVPEFNQEFPPTTLGDETTAGPGSTSAAADDGPHTIAGGAGNDSVAADAANDTLTGSAGNDTWTSPTGNDSLTMSTSAQIGVNDTLTGGQGNDSVAAGASNDTISGGAATDTAKAK